MRFKVLFNQKMGDLQNIHNEDIQKWIYTLIAHTNPALSKTIHDKGYTINKQFKPIKPFVFSRIYQTKYGPALKISTPVPEIIFALSKSLASKPELYNKSKDTVLKVTSIDVRQFRNTVKFFTLSPVILKTGVNYTALSDRNKIYETIKFNLIKKYQAIYGKEIKNPVLGINLEDSLKFAKQTFKGYQIQGVIGEITLYGDEELVRIAYECGLGAKNACGFGCIESAKRD
jgi:CRISPR-associated endoribonuclease Cas6